MTQLIAIDTDVFVIVIFSRETSGTKQLSSFEKEWKVPKSKYNIQFA